MTNHLLTTAALIRRSPATAMLAQANSFVGLVRVLLKGK